MAVFVFDIETVPDVELGRRVYGLHDLSDKQVGYEKPRSALVTEDGEFLEYLPEREYTDISEGKAPRFEGIKSLKRTYVFERAGMPPASQTDVGRVPPEVKKRLKEEARARKAAEAQDSADGKENA